MASFVARGRNSTWKWRQKSRSLFSNYHYQRGQRAAALRTEGRDRGKTSSTTRREGFVFFDDPVSVVDYFQQKKKTRLGRARLGTLFGGRQRKGGGRRGGGRTLNKEVRLCR